MVFMQINVLFICLVIFVVVVDYVFLLWKNSENINKHGMRKGENCLFSFRVFFCVVGYSRILPNYGYFNCCSGDFKYVLIREFSWKESRIRKQIFILNFKIFSKYKSIFQRASETMFKVLLKTHQIFTIFKAFRINTIGSLRIHI